MFHKIPLKALCSMGNLITSRPISSRIRWSIICFVNLINKWCICSLIKYTYTTMPRTLTSRINFKAIKITNNLKGTTFIHLLSEIHMASTACLTRLRKILERTLKWWAGLEITTIGPEKQVCSPPHSPSRRTWVIRLLFSSVFPWMSLITTKTRYKIKSGSQEECKRNKGQILVSSPCNSSSNLCVRHLNSSSPFTTYIRNKVPDWNPIRIVRVNIPKAIISRLCQLIIRNSVLRSSTNVSNLLPRTSGSLTLTNRKTLRYHFVSNQESTWFNQFKPYSFNANKYHPQSKKCNLKECLSLLDSLNARQVITVEAAQLLEIYLTK